MRGGNVSEKNQQDRLEAYRTRDRLEAYPTRDSLEAYRTRDSLEGYPTMGNAVARRLAAMARCSSERGMSR